jgi:serine/threonine-protein kinase
LKKGEERLDSISHYALLHELGEGGMGTVFLADHVSEHNIRKRVAIKIIKESHDANAIQRLIEEARLLARLGQGTIVELLALESKELTTPGGRAPKTGAITPPRKQKLYFMVQEYVNGPSLEKVFKDHTGNKLLMAPAMVGFILNKSALALAEAHTLTDDFGANLNLVHRDISPGNILFMAKAGITKLADFGVAKAFADFTGGQTDEKKKIVGKPRYMAPEQLNGDATAASDIWSLGVIGYEALVGYAPYRVLGSTTQERVANLKAQHAFPLRSPAECLVPDAEEHFALQALSDIIMKCLSLDPADRPTALQLNEMLEGSYLYAKGLGPTNKTLAGYLTLLEGAMEDGEIVSPPHFADGPLGKAMTSTLHCTTPNDSFRRRSTAIYQRDLLLALKHKESNPCLKALGEDVFSTEVGIG